MSGASLTITLGDGSASCAGVTSTHRKGAICDLARKLIESGHDPAAPVAVFRDGTPAFRIMRLRDWAHWTVTENDRTSARFTEYKPLPENAFGVSQ